MYFVDPLQKPHGWAYTSQLETEGYKQLSHILENYPVPSYLNSISKGSLFYVNSVKENADLEPILSSFIATLGNSTPSKSIDKTVIESIGTVPLREIDDPTTHGKVKRVFTFDVSYNPALSIKDVIARQLIEDALKAKKIVPGKTIIVEATSGNTGAGLALMGSYYGLVTVLVVPDKVSEEKIDRLRKLGAHVIVSPTNVVPNDPRSYYSIRDLLGKHKQVWVPQQYDNPSNANAHRLFTGPRIWDETDGKVTTVIIPAGTGGTISGIGHYLKKKNPNIKVIGVDTVGSILSLLKQGYSLDEVKNLAHSYDIQGFGEDFKPKNMDFSVIDTFIKISDISGLQMTQMLPSLGFFQGQSSGAAYAAFLEAIDTNYINKDDSVFIMFPDVGIPYRHDVYNDEWMKLKKFSINY